MKILTFTLALMCCMSAYSQKKSEAIIEGEWMHEYAIIEGEMLTEAQTLDFEKRYNEQVKGNQYIFLDENGTYKGRSSDLIRWTRDYRENGEYIIFSKPFPRDKEDPNSKKEWQGFLHFRIVNNNLLELTCVRGGENSLFSIKNGKEEFELFHTPIDGVKYKFYFRRNK